MATLVNKFKKQVIGSAGKIYDYIPTITPYGDFKRITDIDVIVNSYSVILQTPSRTYDHDPTFGCDLTRFIFEPADEITRMQIDDVLRSQLFALESRAKLKTFNITYYNNGKGFLLDIVVSYNNTQKQISVPITANSI